jgi:hypothetical protein
MWSRYHFLTGRVRVRDKDTRVFVPIPPLAIYAVRSAVLSADGLLGLIPGSAGRKVCAGADAVQMFLGVLLDDGMSVNVKVDSGDERVRVSIRMV